MILLQTTCLISATHAHTQTGMLNTYSETCYHWYFLSNAIAWTKLETASSNTRSTKVISIPLLLCYSYCCHWFCCYFFFIVVACWVIVFCLRDCDAYINFAIIIIVAPVRHWIVCTHTKQRNKRQRYHKQWHTWPNSRCILQKLNCTAPWNTQWSRQCDGVIHLLVIWYIRISWVAIYLFGHWIKWFSYEFIFFLFLKCLFFRAKRIGKNYHSMCCGSGSHGHWLTGT